MTLIGLDSRSEEFDNLTLTVGMGTKLTLQDVRITGDKTLLSLAGGNTLTLLGENRLIGCADAPGNACPTVISGGDLTICGSGSLKLQALVNNAAFMGAETSKISIETCLISVFKSDKLGFDCGAFCANGADLTMTNATFFGRTDSDNVAILSADTIAMTGCTLRVEAEKSVHALLGSVSIADCSLYASGHSGNSAKTVSQTAGLDAFETVSQQSGVTASAADALLSVYTQAGEDGEKTLAKSYTAEELKKLAETKADGYGYQYFKKGEQDVVVTEFVTLDALLTDADVTFADGDSLPSSATTARTPSMPPPTRTSPRASITSRTARLKKSPPLSRWSGVSAQPLTAPWPILPRPLKKPACASSAARPRPTSRLKSLPASVCRPA